MVEDISQDIPDLLNRSERSLEAALLLINNEYYPEAVSRAYYAMFFAATALLHSEGITVSKHSAVISQIGQHFAKTGKIDAQLHRALIDVFDERQSADYGGIVFSHEDTESAYQAAGKFVQAVKDYLDEQNKQN
jgi:uncharacterized protein (UPF0332 family)